VWCKHCVDVAGYAVGVVGQGHRGATDDEYVGHDVRPCLALAQGSEGSLELGPAEDDVVGVVHAASRSWADR
jgi:hypothetical protein